MRKVTLFLAATCLAIAGTAAPPAEARTKPKVKECRELPFLERLKNWRECSYEGQRGENKSPAPTRDPDRPSSPCAALTPSVILINGTPPDPDPEPPKPEPPKPEPPKPEPPKPEPPKPEPPKPNPCD